MSVASPFTAYLAENYGQFKAQVEAGLGRRSIKLSMVSDFWKLPAAEKERLAQLAADPTGQDIFRAAQKDIDGVPLSPMEYAEDLSDITESSVLGVVVRTDYTDDEAWSRFVEDLLESEKDLITPLDENVDVPESNQASFSGAEQYATENAGSDTDGSSDSGAESSFAFLDPPESSSLRQNLSGMSNLAALRLLNDVDVASAPAPLAGGQAISTQHRLINLDGFVENYHGPLVWIYDYRSNTDRAARVVSRRPESIEAATGDSWRARSSFLPELQFHVSSGAMKIDFGGLDRWDQVERQRNMAEASVLQ